jgi:rhamnogalacturonan endolyase
VAQREPRFRQHSRVAAVLALVAVACSAPEDQGEGAGAGNAGGGAGTAGSAGTAGTQGAAGATSAGTGAGAGGSSIGGGGGGASGSAGAAGAAGSAAADAGSGSFDPGGGDGFYRMEALDRGLIAVQVQGGVFVGFRVLGTEHDPDAAAPVTYELLRDGELITTLTGATNYLDADGSASAQYAVRPLYGATAAEPSASASVWSEPYLRIPLDIPASGTTPGSPTCETANESFSYSASDASAADLDGDGRYELLLKWDPSNAKDNSQSGCTGPVLIDAYTLAGERLWRLDLGRNIRAGAHYTQLVAIDFDGDGRAELALKTAPGTRDATGAFLSLGPAAGDDDDADYRSVANAGGRTGFVLSGPEYLTVFDGATGAERATVAFEQARGSVNAWGDDYGNRVDRFLATAAYLDDSGLPSIVMARGYYTRTTLTAWTFRGDELRMTWKFDSDQTPEDDDGDPYTGQGAHSLSVANVDDDPEQEIVYGAMAIDHDGSGLCSTGYNHGDALHVGDLVPSHPGLEAFMCNEDGDHPAWHLRDARSCEIVREGPVNGEDTGRCVAADVVDDSPGAEMWASSVDGLIASDSGESVGNKPSATNFLVYWDGDDLRELLDQTSITKPGAGDALLRCSECTANNGTKATPTLVADLVGDWREEVIWRETDSSALRLYTTTVLTERRLFTLMHDPQYRIAVAWQNVAYNQPPHPSFALGPELPDPSRPDIRTR